MKHSCNLNPIQWSYNLEEPLTFWKFIIKVRVKKSRWKHFSSRNPSCLTCIHISFGACDACAEICVSIPMLCFFDWYLTHMWRAGKNVLRLPSFIAGRWWASDKKAISSSSTWRGLITESPKMLSRITCYRWNWWEGNEARTKIHSFRLERLSCPEHPKF